MIPRWFYAPLVFFFSSCSIILPQRESILFDENINKQRVVCVDENGSFLHETLRIYNGEDLIEKIVDYDVSKTIGNHPLDYHWNIKNGKQVNILDMKKSTQRYNYLKEKGMEIILNRENPKIQ